MKDNVYRQDIATRTPITRVRLITNCLNSNHTKYLAQICGRFFLRFGTFLPKTSEPCGTTCRWNYETWNVLCVVKHTQSSNRGRKQRLNPCIIGDAILPKTGKKIDQKNAVRNLAVCRRAIWRHIENRNIGAQLQSITCLIAPKMFCFLMTFGAPKLVHSEPFLDYRYERLTLALSAM